MDSRFFRRWMGISLAIHLVTAYFSVGYHSADEQFQILEFLAYKLNLMPATGLAVEFSERMRPWTQVGIYWLLVKLLAVFHIESPFTWAFGIRTLTSLIGWASSLGMALCSRYWFKDIRAQRFAIICISLIWFLPCFHARPSSESLAGSAFLIGLCLSVLQWQRYFRPHFSLWFLAGISFGLSFEARFQMGLMIAGFFLWIVFQSPLDRRTRIKNSMAIFLGLVFAIGMGRVIDYWGYGEWSLSPRNYFAYNILRGEVDRYGIAPWWDVFRMSFTESWPFLGLFVAVCSIIAWIRHPKHPLTWSQIPFFLTHEWIAHKELRFFFPIASAAPVLLTMAFYSDKTRKWITIPPRIWKWFKWPWKFLLLNNGVALLALMVVPFSRIVQFYEGVYDAISDHEKKTILYVQAGGRDPYDVLGTHIYFYRPKNLEVRRFKDEAELAVLSKTSEESFLFFVPGFDFPEETLAMLWHCELAFRTLPPFVKSLNYGDWISRTNVWSLYRCEGRKRGIV